MAIIFSFIQKIAISWVLDSWIEPSTKTTKICTPQILSHPQKLNRNADKQQDVIKNNMKNIIQSCVINVGSHHYGIFTSSRKCNRQTYKKLPVCQLLCLTCNTSGMINIG